MADSLSVNVKAALAKGGLLFKRDLREARSASARYTWDEM
jgi:hypothetical protein